MSIKSEIQVPFFLTDFYVTQLVFDLYQLEENVKNDFDTSSAAHQKRTLKSAKKAAKNSTKAAGDRVEVFKLMGTYLWLTGKQKRALKWWTKSMKEGKRLGARLELSRTYFEIGKRLFEPKSKFKKFNELKAEEYLEKAKTMFEEMDLQWDLDQLDRIASHS